LTNYTHFLSKLAAKTILGFATLVLLLAIALFAPAWTLAFWQAWLYLFIFCFILSGHHHLPVEA